MRALLGSVVVLAWASVLEAAPSATPAFQDPGDMNQYTDRYFTVFN